VIRLKQLLEQSFKDINPSHTVILMAGIDYRPGDLSIDDQRRLLSQGIVSNIDIIVHEYDDLNGVLSSITKNPTAFVVLFAEACINAADVVKKLQDAHTMFIVAPSNDLETNRSVTLAVAAGVPMSHVLNETQGSPEELLKGQAGPGIQFMIDNVDIIQSPKKAEPKNIDVPKINISNFKRQWRALGHTIKVKAGQPGPDELSNGGSVDEVLLGIVLELFKEYKQPVNITAGNDTYHHGLPYVSLHTKGKAIDIVPYGGRSPRLEALMNAYKEKYFNFAWDNEYTNPAKMATGPHYHLYLKGTVSTKTPKF